MCTTLKLISSYFFTFLTFFTDQFHINKFSKFQTVYNNFALKLFSIIEKTLIIHRMYFRIKDWKQFPCEIFKIPKEHIVWNGRIYCHYYLQISEFQERFRMKSLAQSNQICADDGICLSNNSLDSISKPKDLNLFPKQNGSWEFPHRKFKLTSD